MRTNLSREFCVTHLEPWTGVLKRFDSENTVFGLPIEPGVLVVDSYCVKEVVPVGGRGGQDPFDLRIINPVFKSK
jgi:hypothetical protein